ncbi:hypothetical protein D1953_15485 [Peribacillus asahii]|uniref:Uncharacterized protein n=1 Tax=Peribacillus asahii TaxID=228899 RepID=A0A398B1J4_9BACI|nr:hypothetical protein [Peribacillus asahii]RID83717.1 hypothetical protein D1953_15485 [Peribacillus asahii]
MKNSFSRAFNVIKVSAPLLLNKGTGINDNLNGIERTVSFQASDINNSQIEVVQSLAKWKRIALARYGIIKF